MASKSYDWDVRNIANISPKWPKNSHFSFFFDFLKNCPYDSNESFYSHSTPYYGSLCAFSLNSYGWDVRNIAKINPKMAKKQPFFGFFDFCKNCPYDSNEILYSPSTLYYGPMCAPRLPVMARSWKIIHDHGFFNALLLLSWKIMDGQWQGMAPWIIIHRFDPWWAMLKIPFKVDSFLLLCEFLPLLPEDYINGPGSIKEAFRHRVSWSREIGKILVSIRWTFDGFGDSFRWNCGKTQLPRSVSEKT